MEIPLVPGNHKNVHLINKSLERPVSAVSQHFINIVFNTVWGGLKWVGLPKLPLSHFFFPPTKDTVFYQDHPLFCHQSLKFQQPTAYFKHPFPHDHYRKEIKKGRWKEKGGKKEANNLCHLIWKKELGLLYFDNCVITVLETCFYIIKTFYTYALIHTN